MSDANLDFELPSSVDPENLDKKIADGRYQVLVKKVDRMDKDGKPKLIVDYEVLTGNTPGQEGMTGREFIPMSGQAMGRLVKFAVAAGITTISDLAKARAANTPPKIAFGSARDKTLIVDIKKNGEYANWTFGGMFNLNDPEVSDFPKIKLEDLVGGVSDVTPF